ncbi:glycosyltransferase [Arcticibacter eurypsychrophilus]|uniref:glycosyltransferase n=1 Tax=Arcticibacter eurypsychrophilus TaxID=1434752 RepID=UPI00084D67AE|nr:glycosyltransferase [Arcticibacter eurypsychrophilus]
MNILIVSKSRIPAFLYGGIERITWWLGKELAKMGHQVTYLVNEGSTCPFAKVICRDYTVPLESQVPVDIDVVHFQYPIVDFSLRPFIVTIHGNNDASVQLSRNSVFISKDHAKRHHAETYIYNGIDIEEYGAPDFRIRRDYFHFLGKAAWRIKNVQGAIDVALKAKERLEVLGGNRLNITMGFRFTLSSRIRFRGIVGGEEKNAYLRASRGLIFPVRWHEPFGIALIESLYFGCPVFGTPYGSLPEIVVQGMGVLSDSLGTLSDALKDVNDFDRKKCHEYVCDQFLAATMTRSYVELYERVLNGRILNSTTPYIKESNEKFLPWRD